MNFKNKFSLLLFTAIALSSCGITRTIEDNIPEVVIVKETQEEGSQIDPIQFAKLYTSVWMQRSAEYKALCFQAFNIATEKLHKAVLDENNKHKKLAIITDIDETFLDNSPNSVHQALKNELFNSQSWTEWCNMGVASPLPGSIEFFKEAERLGVEVFYITNRNLNEAEGTLKNLKDFGFPYADGEHLMPKADTSNKDVRRNKVFKNYEVILFLGDNLGDFSSAFDKVSEKQREEELVKIKEKFGDIFIVLPNPNYGTWENAVLEYKRLEPKEQEEMFIKKAQTY